MFGQRQGLCTNWTGCPLGQAKSPINLSEGRCPSCGGPLTPLGSGGTGTRLGLAGLVLFVAGLAAAAVFISHKKGEAPDVPPIHAENTSGTPINDKTTPPAPRGNASPDAPAPAPAAQTPSPLSRPQPALTTADRGPYGVIEIGGTGIKAFVFDIDRAEGDPECARDQDQYITCLDLRTLKAINRGPVIEGSEPDTVRAVVTQYDLLTQKYLVAPARIFIVGSSSVAAVPHRESIRTLVQDTVEPVNAMDFLTVEQEAAYGYEGVLGMVPARWRPDRDRRAVSLDIGGGNTKGAYRETPGDGRGLATYGLPYGTKSFMKYILDHVPGSSFSERAATARRETIDPAVRAIAARLSGIGNRDRVYLMGGIVFALVTHTQPDTRKTFPVVDMEHVERLYQIAARPDAMRVLCTENPRLPDSETLRTVCNGFAPEDLMAGLEILRACIKEMKLDNKKMFFMRDGLYAWPLGYAVAKVRDRG